MKKTITLLTILCVVNVFATDRFVDPNLSEGNGTNLFTTITDAVAAAVNGDRIIVVSSTYNEAALTIDKSLQIIPLTAGTTINCNFQINVGGFPGMNLEIVGFNLGIYNFNFLQINGGSKINRAEVRIIDCSAENIFNLKKFYKTDLISNNINKGITFSYGNIINNTTKYISVFDEDENSPETDESIKIINNQVEFLIGIYNNDYPIVIANNTFRDLAFRRWNANENHVNYIFNNNFTEESVLHFSIKDVPYYNIIFTNNQFTNNFYMANSTCSGNPYLSTAIADAGYNTIYSNDLLLFNYNNWMPYWINSSCNAGWYCQGPDNPIRMGSGFCHNFSLNGSDEYLNPGVSGFFEFSYNGIESTMNIPNSSSPLNFTNIAGPENAIDGGNPNHKYYDIDLTINDRGINGGPYSQLNYNASNPNNSRAFIFDLEMPADLFPGQDVEIKAKGYHKN